MDVLEKVNYEKDKEVYWHTTAHILAAAVKRLYPTTTIAIGPAIENGFYYDFDNLTITEEDLKKIEEEMDKVIKADLKLKKEVVTKQKALEIFKDEPYKTEMINDLPTGEEISVYHLGTEITDLCRGPHLASTKMVGAVKLTSLAGAYWRGDSKNKMLTRIYGISFPDKKQLRIYLDFIEEMKRRDHRILGQKLDLFSFHKEAPGMPFFHDKGTFIWNQLVKYVTELMEVRDYEINKTPIVLNKDLWLQSGHWDHYKNNMYFTKIDDFDYAVKPMNCPGNILIYKTNKHSYRDLPIRAGEFGLVHRHELSGTLSGLFRVRAFTQDDAHVFCTKEQLNSEIKNLLGFMDEVYKKFGFEYSMELSTKPENAMGSAEQWDIAEVTLKTALEEFGSKYKVNEGDGAFYGPKIDFHLKNAMGASWQCGTIQLDFQMPEKFDLTYMANDNTEKRPIMLHRAVLGSVERFLGILIEHFAGRFPLWLNPRQIIVVPVAETFNEYAEKIAKELKEAGLRVSADLRETTLNKKIRDAEVLYYNYILVVGEKEVKEKSVNARIRDSKVQKTVSLKDFIPVVQKEYNKRELKSSF